MENDDEDKYTSVSDDPLSNLILEVIKNDSLRKIERGKRHEAEHCILTAAKVISPVSFSSFLPNFWYHYLMIFQSFAVPLVAFNLKNHQTYQK